MIFFFGFMTQTSKKFAIPALDKAYLHQTVRKVQKQAAMAITGALRITPSDDLDTQELWSAQSHQG